MTDLQGMKNSVKIALIAAAATAGLNSCVKEEQFPIEPHVTYKSFTTNTDGSATLVLEFTDGDGDIGIEPDEQGTNLYLYYYYKNASGDFVPYDNPQTPDLDTVTRAYRVMPIYSQNPGKKPHSSKGEIQVM